MYIDRINRYTIIVITIVLFQLQFLNAQEKLAQTSVLMGKQDYVALSAAHSIILTLPRHELDNVVVQKDFAANTTAPVSPGQELGTARVVVQNRELASVPLIALEKIEQAGPIKKIVHTIKLSFIQPPYWGALLLVLLLVAACIVKLATRQKKKGTSGYRT